MVALWLQKLLEKIKLRRMSGIPPQYLELKARYRANIKYRDQSLNREKTLEMPENTEFLGGVVADWLQNRVINLLSE